MKNYSSALALAAALALPMTAAQAAVEFGGDYEVNAYTLDMGDLQDDDTAALQHRLRLKAHFQNEDGVQVNARVSLADNTWMGNSGPTTDATVFNNQTGSDVTLDYGYVQIPFNLGVLRVGRQETSWAHGLLIEQERRDRILGITKLGNTTLTAFYDKGSEGELDADDDVSSYNVAATGSLNGWVWGILGIYYEADDTEGPDTPADTAAIANAARDGMIVLSPFFQGQIGNVTLQGAVNITDGFERERFADVAALAAAGSVAPTPADAVALQGLAALEDETGIAAFLRAAAPVGPVTIEGQVLFAQDGGTVNQGFDTFSSFINNDPVTDSNPLSVMSAHGMLTEETMLAALRVSGNVTDKIKLQVSGGIIDVEGGVYANDATLPFTAADESAEFYELNAYYQATPSTTLWATVGQLAAEDIVGDDITGMSLNLRTDF